MRLTKESFLLNFGNQSSEVPLSGGARQSSLNPSGVVTGRLFDDVRTVADVPIRGLKVSGNGPCLGWRDINPVYKWLSYQEVIDRYRCLSFGLLQIGMKAGQHTFVGIYGKNCVEWLLVDHACHCQSVVPVPLYDSLGPSACTFILNQTEAETVACDTRERAASLLNLEVPALKRILLMLDEPGDELRKAAQDKGVALHTLREVEDLGRESPGQLLLPEPDDLATICYTSGTTGNPKGVMLSHANMVADSAGLLISMGSNYLSTPDRYLSYLPLAHMLERESQVVVLSVGASIGFWRGDRNLLFDDLQALRPTILAAVPRILNRIYDKVWAQLSSRPFRRFLLRAALQAKKAELDSGVIRNDSLWDRVVLKAIRNLLGGDLRLLVSAGAPIRDEVLTFFRCCMGCPVVQGYGQTESTAAGTVTLIGDNAVGVVGPPMPCCIIRLEDVPEMGYYAKNNEGEILIKGPIVSRGYFKDPEKTAETFDKDGWLHSGDIGRWTEEGCLSIVDRKKNLLKLSQGEYVSPEKVESVYLGSPCIDQMFVDGDPLESFLVAIVVPDRSGLEALASSLGIQGEWATLCNNQTVRESLLRELRKIGQEAGLQGYEQVKAILLHPEPFCVEDGTLTPTLKIKRTECRRRFQNAIRGLYGKCVQK